MKRSARRSLLAVCLGLLAMIVLALPVSANHAWGNYHWARTSNPFTLKLGDNVSSTWDSYLRTASTDWSKSSVLDTTIVAGQAGTKQCKATTGRVEVCAATYGNNGWLGIASISVSGSHITAAVVKMNDTYFNTATYNTSAWRNMVMCQEVGHAFGLDHQDENFDNANLGTCMDYTNNPGTNQHPNSHDYAMLESIYSHTDSTTTVLSAGLTMLSEAVSDSETHEEFGRVIERDAKGNPSLFVRNLGNGDKQFTHVFWLPE